MFLKLSICIPTYNNASTIKTCLQGIKSQDYPVEFLEIIAIDGGSIDNTLEICKKYTGAILNNPNKIEEMGKVLGIKRATGDVIAFIDADNFLIENNFFKKMMQPFLDNDKVVFSEPKFYFSTEQDNLITKYISLIGGDDPIAVYLGVYDRYCYFKSDWTDSPYEIMEKKENYEIIRLKDVGEMPPFGANGCFIKKNALLNVKFEPFLHTDVIYRLLVNNNIFAKVNTGIIHRQDGSLVNYLKKKSRRLNRNYRDMDRQYYFNIGMVKKINFILKSTLIFPLFIDSFIGYKNKKNIIWFLHPIIVLITFFTYLYSVLFRRKNGIG